MNDEVSPFNGWLLESFTWTDDSFRCAAEMGWDAAIEYLQSTPAHQQQAKDAARYRWLRDGESGSHDDPYCVAGHPEATLYRCIDGDELDAAIDSAMQERGDG